MNQILARKQRDARNAFRDETEGVARGTFAQPITREKKPVSRGRMICPLCGKTHAETRRGFPYECWERGKALVALRDHAKAQGLDTSRADVTIELWSRFLTAKGWK